jgi:MFS family permease
VTLTVSLAILVSNFGTSIISPGLQIIAQDFGVSIEVGILAISLYLIGFGITHQIPVANESYWATFCRSIIGRVWS